MNAATPLRPHLRLVPAPAPTPAPAPDPDRALAERLHRRERSALADVYRFHHAAIRAAAAPIAGASSAADVTQEVFLIVAQRPTSMPLDGLADYLVRLARSVARERAGLRAHDLCLDDLDAMARRGIPRSRRKPGAD